MGFTAAVATGLAADGGLLIPGHIPDARARLDAWRQLPYRRLAEEIVRLYWDDCDCDLAGMIGRSYAGRRSRSRTSRCSCWATSSSTSWTGPAGG